MAFWRQLTRGLRALTRPDAADRDIADELAHYLDEAAATFEHDGLPPEEARRAALRQLGSVTAARERVRSAGWENVVETLIADLRYAGRRLRRDPGFAAVAVLTLAIGIGASTAMFSVVKPILLEPLPYPHAWRLVMIWDTGRAGSRHDVTFGTYRELAQRSHSFDALAVMRPSLPTLTGGAEPERLDGQRVSWAYFRALGVSPSLGRDFHPDEDRLGGPRVVILSAGLWRRRFDADPAIVGREIALDGDPHTVVGVMPASFENVLAPSGDVWRPLQYDASLPSVNGREWGHHLRLAGRLRDGVSIDQAARELDGIARHPIPEFPRPRWASLESGFITSALQQDLTRGVRPALLAVFGAVMLLLAIACVNVANLLLVRSARRRAEFAMRAALGASRARLARQLLTESLLLACLGGALGLVVANGGVGILVALSPASLPRAGAIALDATVFAFAAGLTAAIALGIGMLPAMQVSRGSLHEGIQQGSHRLTGGFRATRRILGVAEVALAVVLLVSAGLLVRTMQRLFAVDAGFDSASLLTMQVQASGHKFDDDEVTHRFYEDVLDAVRNVPGVSAAALTSQLPLSGDFDVYGVHFESSVTPVSDDDRGAYRYAVSPGYFEAMRIPIRRGRSLDARDAPGTPLAVVINESFARRRFLDRDPIGQRLHVGPDSGPWYTIVGIAGDVKQVSLAANDRDAVYLRTTQWHFVDRALWIVVRARGEAASLAPAVRRAVWSIDKDQPIVRIATMDSLLAASVGERRFALLLFQVFGLAALALAAIGLYGLLAGSVAERTREIGVRSALGASRGHILSQILREGMAPACVGLAIGLALSLVATRAVGTLLFGVPRLDLLTYGAVTTLLMGASTLACGVPAWRATRIDPVTTLRVE
jgi:putative ABC transport system permease protein